MTEPYIMEGDDMGSHSHAENTFEDFDVDYNNYAILLETHGGVMTPGVESFVKTTPENVSSVADRQNWEDLANIQSAEDKLSVRRAIVEANEAAIEVLGAQIRLFEGDLAEPETTMLPYRDPLIQKQLDQRRNQGLHTHIRRLKGQIGIHRRASAQYEESISMLITTLDSLYAKPFEGEEL